jgi:hypothetical protein
MVARIRGKPLNRISVMTPNALLFALFPILVVLATKLGLSALQMQCAYGSVLASFARNPSVPSKKGRRSATYFSSIYIPRNTNCPNVSKSSARLPPVKSMT